MRRGLGAIGSKVFVRSMRPHKTARHATTNNHNTDRPCLADVTGFDDTHIFHHLAALAVACGLVDSMEQVWSDIRQDYGFLVADRAAEIFEQKRPARWPAGDWTYVETVHLPEAPDQELLLVLSWHHAGSEPLMLLVSPQARRPGRNGRWFMRAYRRRWGVEDATWGIKQRFHLEGFLVQSWCSIRRLIYLVAIAFYWLNLWGQDRFTSLRNALIHHPWRLPKKVIYLFDWLATQISRFLHPKPKISPTGYLNTG